MDAIARRQQVERHLQLLSGHPSASLKGRDRSPAWTQKKQVSRIKQASAKRSTTATGLISSVPSYIISIHIVINLLLGAIIICNNHID